MTKDQGNRAGEQQSDTHAGEIQQDRGMQKQDLKPAQQNQAEQDGLTNGASTNQKQEKTLDNNRGGADPTGGQAIREGGGPGENIGLRSGEDTERAPETGQGQQQEQPISVGQSAEQPAEGPQSDEELARQNPK